MARAEGAGEARLTPGARLTRVLLGLGVLSAFGLVGEVLIRVLGLPLPGATLGMVLLLIALGSPARRRLERLVTPAADLLIMVLPLLLVPTAVGVVDSLGVIGGHALAIGVALLGGWIATLIATAGVAALVTRVTLLLRQARP